MAHEHIILLTRRRDKEHMGVGGGGGGRVLDHEKSKWLMSISWSHGLPVPLPTYVLSVSSSREQMDMLMRHLMFSRSHETKSTKMAHEHINLLARQQDGEHMGWEGESQTRRP